MHTKQTSGVDDQSTGTSLLLFDQNEIADQLHKHPVAMEALQEAWRTKRVTMAELWHYAELCRMSRLMRPYLEMLQVVGAASH
jgi:hypothetical protein